MIKLSLGNNRIRPVVLLGERVQPETRTPAAPGERGRRCGGTGGKTALAWAPATGSNPGASGMGCCFRHRLQQTQF